MTYKVSSGTLSLYSLRQCVTEFFFTISYTYSHDVAADARHELAKQMSGESRINIHK